MDSRGGQRHATTLSNDQFCSDLERLPETVGFADWEADRLVMAMEALCSAQALTDAAWAEAFADPVRSGQLRAALILLSKT